MLVELFLALGPGLGYCRGGIQATSLLGNSSFTVLARKKPGLEGPSLSLLCWLAE
jgi:hypothetical protein